MAQGEGSGTAPVRCTALIVQDRRGCSQRLHRPENLVAGTRTGEIASSARLKTRWSLPPSAPHVHGLSERKTRPPGGPALRGDFILLPERRKGGHAEPEPTD